MVLQSWDPCSLFGGLFLLPLPLFLISIQFQATFRADRHAALRCSMIYGLLASFTCLSLAYCLVQGLGSGELLSQWPWLTTQIGMLVYASLAAAVNYGQFAANGGGEVEKTWDPPEIQSSVPEQGVEPQVIEPQNLKPQLAQARGFPWAFSLVMLLGILAGAAVIFGLTPARTGQHVAAEQSPIELPTDARDVSYARGFRGTVAVEFQTGEARFRHWVATAGCFWEARRQGTEIQEIQHSFSVPRYLLLLDSDSDSPAIIESGLYYHWEQEDRAVVAAYDRAAGRGYCFIQNY